MKSMFEIMSQSGKMFANFFLEKNQDIVEVECKDIFLRFCSDNIATFAFGIKTDSLKEPNNEFFLMGKETTDLSPIWRHLRFKFMLLAPEAAAVSHSADVTYGTALFAISFLVPKNPHI